jgi:spermidine synthase
MTSSPSHPCLWFQEFHTPWDFYGHGVTHVLAHCQTPFQEASIVETGAYGKGLILDGHWQSAVGDEFLYHEPLVHTPCVLQGSPRRVLILGGGEGATLREVLRWRTVETVVMVDIDGAVVDLCQTHLPEMHQDSWDDRRVQLVIADVQDYLSEFSQNQQTWDVIISDLTDPVVDGPAAPLFTQTHFQEIAQVLAPGGFYMMQGGSLNPPDLATHARVVNTVATAFAAVQTCFCYAPTYGVALGLILASQSPWNTSPNAATIDGILATQTTGGLRMFDGSSLLGILNVPKHIRQAIEDDCGKMERRGYHFA